jgi:murein DD-endopeptidase MepM/ murein hydrolase activator NlpD
MESLNVVIVKFEKSCNVALENGLKVDKSAEKKAIHSYLLELRALQKEYDYLVHLINEKILQAIHNKDSKLFLQLTNYELEGVLKNSSLKNRALEFYSENCDTNSSLYLEKIIKEEKLIAQTSREFYEQSIKDSYSSKNKKRNSKKKVFMSAVQKGNIIYVSLKNRNFYDVTLKIKSKYKNLIQLKDEQETVVVKAKSTLEYTELKLGKGANSYRYSYRWIIGDKDAVHDDAYLYRLPYAKGESHRVSQGFNGSHTHKGRSAYAVDFAMKTGTKIYAAREGVVVKTKSNSNRGGNSKEFRSSGNYVTIAHSDGTLATYYHLKQKGVVVKIGQKVQRGSHIAYSGNTGYSSGPHLHFAVFKAISASQTHTVPVKFISANGVLTKPIKGFSYKAK